MRIVVHGPAAGNDWTGTMQSWTPDQPVEIDDGNKAAVAWARAYDGTLVTITEDVKTPKSPRTPAA